MMVMACIAITYLVMACVVMTYVVTTYLVMAYNVMACKVMAWAPSLTDGAEDFFCHHRQLWPIY